VERVRRPEEEHEEAREEEPQPLDSGTVMALQAADPSTRARALLQLQRSHGNEAVQRVIRALQTTDAARDARVQSIGDRAEESAPSGQLERAVLYREAIAAELDAAPATSKTERELVQDNVNTVGQIFANYQAALHLFEHAMMGGAGERVPRELAVELLREVAREVFEPVLDACVGVAPGMEDLVGDGIDLIIAVQAMQRKVELDKPVGKHMNIDDLVDIGNSIGLGDRGRIDRVAGRAGFLAVNVDPQIGGQGGIISGVIGAIHRGCPVNHRAGGC